MIFPGHAPGDVLEQVEDFIQETAGPGVGDLALVQGILDCRYGIAYRASIVGHGFSSYYLSFPNLGWVNRMFLR